MSYGPYIASLDSCLLVGEAYGAIKQIRRSLIRARAIANDNDDDDLRAAIAMALADVDKAGEAINRVGNAIYDVAGRVAPDPLPPACSFVYVISFDPDAEPQTGTCAFMPEDIAR